MTEELASAINVLEQRLSEQLDRVATSKKLINQLCIESGLPIRYPEAEIMSAGSRTIRGDQFYGQPLASAVREILEMRKAAGMGAATVNEIHALLVQGGFQFEAKDDENAKRSLRISLTKNSTMFHRLPNGQYGLLLWYPAVKPPKAEPKNDPHDPGEEENETSKNEERTSGTGAVLGSIMITRAQKAQLKENGYTDEQIDKLKPEEAHKILGLTK
jgi:hypothetical protein